MIELAYDDDETTKEGSLRARIAELERGMNKINDIRNSIIGYQTINWSAHIYPLVAALEDAGFHGEGSEVFGEKAKTQLQRIEELESDIAALRQEIDGLRNGTHTTYADLSALHEQLQVENATLRQGMEKLEWIKTLNSQCPACEQYNPKTIHRFMAMQKELIGHKPDCWLAALLKGEKSEAKMQGMEWRTGKPTKEGLYLIMLNTDRDLSHVWSDTIWQNGLDNIGWDRYRWFGPIPLPGEKSEVREEETQEQYEWEESKWEDREGK